MIRSNALSERVVRKIEPRSESKGKYVVYILKTSSNTLYIGQTNNLEKRLKEHKSKGTKSARYIKYFQSFQLVHSEEYSTRVEAMKREYQLKKWTRQKKEALINQNKTLLKR